MQGPEGAELSSDQQMGQDSSEALLLGRALALRSEVLGKLCTAHICCAQLDTTDESMGLYLCMALRGSEGAAELSSRLSMG